MNCPMCKVRLYQRYIDGVVKYCHKEIYECKNTKYAYFLHTCRMFE